MLVKLPLCDGSVPPGVWFPLAQAAEGALRCSSGAAWFCAQGGFILLSQHPQKADLTQGNLDMLSVKDVKL